MSTQRPIKVEKNSVLVGNRNRLNLIEGANVTLTVTDDPTDNEIDVTIAAAAGTARVDIPTYVMWVDGGTYYARNGLSGAVTSGANFVTLINATIAACSAGNDILIKAGTYVVAASIVLKSGVSVTGSGSGTVLDATTMAAADYVIEGYGTTGSATTSNGAVTRGGTTVTFTSAAAYTDKDLFMLYNATVWKANVHGSTQGEILEVYGAPAGNVVTLSGCLQDSYASGANILKITPIKDLSIENLKILGDDNIVGIQIGYASNLHVRKVHIDTCKERGINFYNSVGCSVSDCKLYRVNRTGFGYGVSASYATQGFRVSNCEFWDCRHGFDLNGTGAGITRNTLVEGCVSHSNIDGLGAAFDSHAFGEQLWFVNCHVYGGYNGFAGMAYTGGMIGCSAQDGVNYGVTINTPGTQSWVMSNCSVSGYPNGVYINGANNVRLVGCDISRNLAQGVYLNAASRVAIQDCTIEQNGVSADHTYENVRFTGDCNNVIISGCTIYKGAAAPQSHAGIQIDAGTDDLLIVGNQLALSGTDHVLVDGGTGTVIRSNVGLADN